MQNRENREKEIHVSKRKRGERDKEKGGGRIIHLQGEKGGGEIIHLKGKWGWGIIHFSGEKGEGK